VVDPSLSSPEDDKIWEKHVKKSGAVEGELYYRARYPFEFPKGFTQPPEVFHAIVCAIPDHEIDALSLYDIAHRARTTWRHVLYALSFMSSTCVLHRKPATKTGPALIWLPPPAANDPGRDFKARMIAEWRSTKSRGGAPTQPEVAPT
jgi:hypothetical protein